MRSRVRVVLPLASVVAGVAAVAAAVVADLGLVPYVLGVAAVLVGVVLLVAWRTRWSVARSASSRGGGLGGGRGSRRRRHVRCHGPAIHRWSSHMIHPHPVRRREQQTYPTAPRHHPDSPENGEVIPRIRHTTATATTAANAPVDNSGNTSDPT